MVFHWSLSERNSFQVSIAIPDISLFNGISTFVGYLMAKPSFEKNSNGTI